MKLYIAGNDRWAAMFFASVLTIMMYHGYIVDHVDLLRRLK